MNESKYHDVDFWFNKPELHGDDHQYTKSFWGYQFYNQLITKIKDIPSDGYIVLLGSRNCESFNLLCDHFGHDRCIGYDLANPTGHPNVKIKNVLTLDDKDDIPIAFVHNDIGSFVFTPLAKLHAQQWAARNVLPGGYFLGRNNLNSARYPLEELMVRYGFSNTDLLTLTGLFDAKNILTTAMEGHMLSKKIGRKDLW